MLVLQAGEDTAVTSKGHEKFCANMKAAGKPCEGGEPDVIPGAWHELFIESDEYREPALTKILQFLAKQQ